MTGMMEKLIALDKELFLYLNQHHASSLDPVMFWMSQTYTWFPLYAFLLFIAFKNYRERTWLLIVCVAVTITLSDQLASGVLKPIFMRLRPSHDPELENLAHYVNGYKGGLYGFASSHASNVFALATFFWLVFRKQYRSVAILFVWAAVVAYTRIYLGVHFPGDVIVGALIGVLAAWIGYQLFSWGIIRFTAATDTTHS